MTIARNDIETQVYNTLASQSPESDGVDQTAVVGDIIDTYGLVDIETIAHDEFWAIVAKHDS